MNLFKEVSILAKNHYYTKGFEAGKKKAAEQVIALENSVKVLHEELHSWQGVECPLTPTPTLIMRYRLVESEDEIIVLLEDGGIACIREIGELDRDDGRQSTSDYYQTRMVQDMLDTDSVWDDVGEGKMYWEDWSTVFTNPKHVQHALEWLCVGDVEFIRDDSLWPDFE